MRFRRDGLVFLLVIMLVLLTVAIGYVMPYRAPRRAVERGEGGSGLSVAAKPLIASYMGDFRSIRIGADDIPLHRYPAFVLPPAERKKRPLRKKSLLEEKTEGVPNLSRRDYPIGPQRLYEGRASVSGVSPPGLPVIVLPPGNPGDGIRDTGGSEDGPPVIYIPGGAFPPEVGTPGGDEFPEESDIPGGIAGPSNPGGTEAPGSGSGETGRPGGIGLADAGGGEPVSPVPIPGSILLFGSGLGGMALLRGGKRNRQK